MFMVRKAIAISGLFVSCTVLILGCSNNADTVSPTPTPKPTATLTPDMKAALKDLDTSYTNIANNTNELKKYGSISLIEFKKLAPAPNSFAKVYLSGLPLSLKDKGWGKTTAKVIRDGVPYTQDVLTYKDIKVIPAFNTRLWLLSLESPNGSVCVTLVNTVAYDYTVDPGACPDETKAEFSQALKNIALKSGDIPNREGNPVPGNPAPPTKPSGGQTPQTPMPLPTVIPAQ